MDSKKQNSNVIWALVALVVVVVAVLLQKVVESQGVGLVPIVGPALRGGHHYGPAALQGRIGDARVCVLELLGVALVPLPGRISRRATATLRSVVVVQVDELALIGHPVHVGRIEDIRIIVRGEVQIARRAAEGRRRALLYGAEHAAHGAGVHMPFSSAFCPNRAERAAFASMS